MQSIFRNILSSSSSSSIWWTAVGKVSVGTWCACANNECQKTTKRTGNKTKQIQKTATATTPHSLIQTRTQQIKDTFISSLISDLKHTFLVKSWKNLTMTINYEHIFWNMLTMPTTTTTTAAVAASAAAAIVCCTNNNDRMICVQAACYRFALYYLRWKCWICTKSSIRFFCSFNKRAEMLVQKIYPHFALAKPNKVSKNTHTHTHCLLIFFFFVAC